MGNKLATENLTLANGKDKPTDVLDDGEENDPYKSYEIITINQGIEDPKMIDEEIVVPEVNEEVFSMIDKLTDLEPHNDDIAQYCRAISSYIKKPKTPRKQSFSGIIRKVQNALAFRNKTPMALPDLMASLDEYMRASENKNWLVYNGKRVLGKNYTFFIKELADYADNEDATKFKRDSFKFLELYRKRTQKTSVMEHKEY